MRVDDEDKVVPGSKRRAQNIVTYFKHWGVKWVIVLHSSVDATWHVRRELLIVLALCSSLLIQLEPEDRLIHITYPVGTVPCTGMTRLAPGRRSRGSCLQTGSELQDVPLPTRRPHK